MLVAIADTHAAVWYLFADRRLSPAAQAFTDTAVARGDQIGISSITFVEIVYLAERGRIHPRTFTELRAKTGRPFPSLIEIPVDVRIADMMHGIPRAEIPEMGDRIIAATALFAGVPVITRDTTIQASSVATVW